MKKVDANALKFNQINIIGWIIVAFIANWPWLVALVGVAMALGTLWPNRGPFRLVYKNLLVPAIIVKPNVIDDDPAPHRFALGFGALVVLAAAATFALGLPVVGWTLAALVALLAFINFAFNYCVGCQIYFLLGRFGIISGERTA